MNPHLVAMLTGTACLVLAAACGGGGPVETDAEQITDPAQVPTSQPIQNPVLYQVRGSEILAAGGRTAVPSGATPAAPRNYTVKEDDTCSSIAAELGVSVDDLRKANRTINDGCTNLRIGDILRVPSAATGGAVTPPTPTPRPGSARAYTVKEGDTCFGIAGSFGVSLDALIARNGLDADCRDLKPGQVLTLP